MLVEGNFSLCYYNSYYSAAKQGHVFVYLYMIKEKKKHLFSFLPFISCHQSLPAACSLL